MKRILFLGAMFLALAVSASATDWPVWIPQESGRVQISTTGNTYTACTQIPFTKSWSFLTLRIESVLDATGTTRMGNAGLGLKLNKTSRMPLSTTNMPSCYKYFSPGVYEFYERDQSTSGITTYYSDTTLTAGDLTKVNLQYDTWKIIRK